MHTRRATAAETNHAHIMHRVSRNHGISTRDASVQQASARAIVTGITQLRGVGVGGRLASCWHLALKVMYRAPRCGVRSIERLRQG